jgi:hypothetical protein
MNSLLKKSLKKKSQNCFSVHLVFHPNSLRCQILSNVPPLEGLVLSRASSEEETEPGAGIAEGPAEGQP